MANETYTLHITLKSGATVDVDVKDATYKSRAGGGGKTLEWEAVDNWKSKLLHIDMNEVAAIIVSNQKAA